MKKIFALVFALSMAMLSMAQEPYALGLILNDEAYDSIPRKVELLTRDYTSIPRAHSLQQYCPTPKTQSIYGTCTSWSTTYAARTICEAIKYGWTDRSKIDQEAFAPLFVYAQIETSGRGDCQNGTYIHEAFRVLKTKGAPKWNVFPELCACNLRSDLFNSAAPYKIDDYFALFESQSVSADTKISKIKKAIASDCPVVISMACYSSFSYAKDQWTGTLDAFRGYHAMCVVAYDDDKYGGAFLIMNSWDTTWGNGGFTWVNYSLFANTVNYAMEMYVKKSEGPLKTNTLSGTMHLQLATGEDITPVRKSESVPYYEMSGSYLTGTRYRLYISNDQPCYVYVLGSDDQTGEVSVVFPSSSRISPALTYTGSNIAIPHEDQYIEMDDTPGRSYLCVLYSADPLDISTVAYNIQGQSGSFAEKVRKGLAGKMVPMSDIRTEAGKITFATSSEAKVVPVVMSVMHK